MFRHRINLCGAYIQRVYLSSAKKKRAKPILPPGDYDLVGPQDPISNMRPLKPHVPPEETELQYKYRIARLETQKWHQDYWHKNNTAFEKEKKIFLTAQLQQKYGSRDGGAKEVQHNVTAEEMAIFYKDFLDKNYNVHQQYNKDWYNRNFQILKLAFRVWLEGIFSSKVGR